MLKKGEKKYPFYNEVQLVTKKVNVKRIIKTRGIFMGYTNYNTDIAKSQEYKVLQKASIKKQENKDVISWLYSIGEKDRAQRLEDCATWLGVSTINGITKVIKSNFCRERICRICAWRRQSKFISQMLPIIDILKSKGYSFIFATLTIQNCKKEDLERNIDILLQGYQLLSKRREVRRAWCGICRSLEITYNDLNNDFHPHIHMLIAIDKHYNKHYISQEKLSFLWQDCIKADYIPVVDIRKVSKDNEHIGAVETLKYSLKPTMAHEALEAFLYTLKGRRLISFSGVFQKQRALLKYSSLDNPEDDIPQNSTTTYDLYRFDATGGIYNFYETYEFKI